MFHVFLNNVVQHNITDNINIRALRTKNKFNYNYKFSNLKHNI